MIINPFAFGAANYPLYGPEHFLYQVLVANYEAQGKIVPGSPRELIEAALKCPDNRWSERGLTAAIEHLLKGDKGGGRLEAQALIRLDKNGNIIPTEHFGVPEDMIP